MFLIPDLKIAYMADIVTPKRFFPHFLTIAATFLVNRRTLIAQTAVVKLQFKYGLKFPSKSVVDTCHFYYLEAPPPQKKKKAFFWEIFTKSVYPPTPEFL